MSKQPIRRLLALVLSATMLAGLAIPAQAAGTSSVIHPGVRELDPSAISAELPRATLEKEESEPLYGPDEMVRVSIVLEDASTIDAGYQTEGIAFNESAKNYRAGLKADQAGVQSAIEKEILGGQELDVTWNLTLAANLISANVPYGQIEAIKAVEGVKNVILEKQYEPQVVSVGGELQPNMAVSTSMTGAQGAWQSGYTGVGSRVAIIDTGIDWDHQSFDPEAFMHAVEEDAEQAGKQVEDYDLLDVDEIAGVLDQLNAYERSGGTAEQYYINDKVPFGYNYIDRNFDITHDHDSEGEHGSHVTGIATANRYLKVDGEFVDAMETVHVVGNAPDAQVFGMKVFGENGGAYDSDYMAAIEDAVILGASAANLSLGSSAAGFTKEWGNPYQDILDNLTSTGLVMACASGNAYDWGHNTYTPATMLYSDDVDFATAGSPASYTNTLSVASVENDGGIDSASLMVDGKAYLYTESTEYRNQPVATMDTSEDGSGTPYDFVLLPGIGAPAEYEGIDVDGKVVLVSRGELGFAEKANNAAAEGAAAVFIYNNEPGTLNMDLSDYTYTAPCASITQEVAAAFKAAAEDHDGKYMTGKLTVKSGTTVIVNGSTYLTMSKFSSWGVAGDLTLKPEITAPGGSIYSVLGSNAGYDAPTTATDQYELMSGTSMATPQITGLTALVNQFIRENGLDPEGMNQRSLAQSLLMSTATPLLRDKDVYYSVFQQGAGLANVAAATSATSYVTVEGQDDGKVKAELGDDPEKEGVYDVTFTIHGLTDRANSYTLSADVFTQAITTVDGLDYLDTSTVLLDADVSFSVNGQTVTEDCGDAYDFDGDGDSDRADAQLLLDHVIQDAELVSNEDKADMDGDGGVDTHDVHELLKALQSAAVTVPANGALTVTATIDVTGAADTLADYVNGAYIEAYLFAKPAADEEGVLPTAHSIPVLGFYGSWSDPSMYDVGTFYTLETGEETRPTYSDNVQANLVLYDEEYIFGGNPLANYPDEKYMPERNAINGDSVISSIVYTPIRNASLGRVTVTDKDGNVLLESYEDGGEMGGIYGLGLFSSFFGQMLMNPNDPAVVGFRPGTVMEEDDTGVVEMKLALEYYTDYDAEDYASAVDWDSLGKGATLSVPFTVDNTAPELDEDSVTIDTEKNILTVTVSDNQYVAGVILLDSTGRRILAGEGSKADAKKGGTATYELDTSMVHGQSFILLAMDYAGNEAAYEINQDIGWPLPYPDKLAFSADMGGWVSFNGDVPGAALNVYAATQKSFSAATTVDGHVFAVTDEGVLYAIDRDGFYKTEYKEKLVADLGAPLIDMAYNEADGMIYGLLEVDYYTLDFASIDPISGEMKDLGEFPYYYAYTLACDENGTFYTNDNTTVCAFTLGDDGEIVLNEDFDVTIEEMDSASSYQAMEYNPNDGKLYWTSCDGFFGYVFSSYYIEIDPEAESYTLHAETGLELPCLVFLPDEDEEFTTFDPTDKITGVFVAPETLNVLVGRTVQMDATVTPWFAKDLSVKWESSDDGVATVSETGLMTAVGEGTAEITATSVADENQSASCKVTVSTLDLKLEGAMMGEDGTVSTFTWDFSSEAGLQKGTKLDGDIFSGTRFDEKTMYSLDYSGETFYKTDLETGEATGLGTAPVPFNDLAKSPFSTEGKDLLEAVNYSYYAAGVDPTAPSYMAFNAYEFINGWELIGAATGSSDDETVTDGESGEEVKVKVVYLMDDYGYIYKLGVFAAEIEDKETGEMFDGYSLYLMGEYASDLVDAGFSLKYNDIGVVASLILGDDGCFYFSAYDGAGSNILYRLSYNESTKSYMTDVLGTAGEGNTPVVLFSAKSTAPAAGNAQTEPTVAKRIDAVKVTEADLAAAAAERAARAAAAAGKQVNGTLNSISAGNATSDADASIVHVPVRSDSTNGEFTLTYDTEKLTLNNITAGPVLISVETDEAEGVIHAGFADDAAVNGVVMDVEFAYDAEDRGTTTVIGLDVTEDGTSNTPASGKYDVILGSYVEIPNLPDVGTPDDGTQSEESGFPFIDVETSEDNWYYEAVKALYEAGIVHGMTEDTFAPNAAFSRAQVAEMLYNMSGSPEVEITDAYSDVSADQWFAKSVSWATANGVVQGADGMFRPDDPVSREELAVMLYRYAKLNGADVESDLADVTFTDAASVSEWAVEAVRWAFSRGIIMGRDDGTFDPAGNATRAEAATVIYRYASATPKPAEG